MLMDKVHINVRVVQYPVTDKVVTAADAGIGISHKLYETVREYISCGLKDVQAISFTTDIWTSDVCPMSLLSLHTGWTQYRHQHLPFKVWCCKQTSSTSFKGNYSFLDLWQWFHCYLFPDFVICSFLVMTDCQNRLKKDVLWQSLSARFYLSQATQQWEQSYHIHTRLVVYTQLVKEKK